MAGQLTEAKKDKFTNQGNIFVQVEQVVYELLSANSLPFGA